MRIGQQQAAIFYSDYCVVEVCKNRTMRIQQPP